jgi:hypothetical protein
MNETNEIDPEKLKIYIMYVRCNNCFSNYPVKLTYGIRAWDQTEKKPTVCPNCGCTYFSKFLSPNDIRLRNGVNE